MSRFLFRLVCLGFSALLLVMSLSRSSRLFDCEQHIASMENELREQRAQAEMLAVRREHRVSLAELETWALEHGMALPDAGQTEYIRMDN